MLFISLATYASPIKEVSLNAHRGFYDYSEQICIRSWKTAFFRKCKTAKYIADIEAQSQTIMEYQLGGKPDPMIPMVLNNEEDLKGEYLKKALVLEKELRFNMTLCEAAQTYIKELQTKVVDKLSKAELKTKICKNAVVHIELIEANSPTFDDGEQDLN